jgi:hypothetical protein
MAKSEPQVDVLVLGDHPAAYLAAALLRHKSKYRIVHSTIPGEVWPDRLVMINPEFYELHPLVAGLKRKIQTRGTYGLQFLADNPAVKSEYRSKSLTACVASFRDVRQALRDLARRQEVEMLPARELRVRRVDERGVEMTVGSRLLRPTALVLAGRLPREQEKILGIPEEWERGIVHRYSFVKLKGTRQTDLPSRPLIPMSLDLRGTLCWAWMLPGVHHTQLCVEQGMEKLPSARPCDLLSHWTAVLAGHGVFKTPVQFTPDQVQSMDLPLGGALAHEGLASRTLLIGPAGGFYTASAEDIYPNCWSAIHAAHVMKTALQEPHLQDALQPYRQLWRTTLGDYLRGPQQNLRFLLPLVYRNPVMAARLAEAILTGRSVVR